MAKHRQEAQLTVPAPTRGRHALAAPQPRGRALIACLVVLAALSGAAIAGTAVLAAAGLVVWLSTVVTAVRLMRARRLERDVAEPVVVEPVVIERVVVEPEPAAAHRATRPRPRVAWYKGVEVSFDLA